jgi:hypothetical protein
MASNPETVAEYRRSERECLDLARTAPTADFADQWRSVAASWRRLADKMEGIPGCKEDTAGSSLRDA